MENKDPNPLGVKKFIPKKDPLEKPLNKAIFGLIERGQLPKQDIEKIPRILRATYAVKTSTSPSKLGLGRKTKQRKIKKSKKTRRHSKKW